MDCSDYTVKFRGFSSSGASGRVPALRSGDRQKLQQFVADSGLPEQDFYTEIKVIFGEDLQNPFKSPLQMYGIILEIEKKSLR